MSHETFDLVVIGGGPSGSTLATFVAMQGHKVLLLEKAKFPRYQIGESLLPATIHGICKMLGVERELKDARFPIKRGGTFRWGKDLKPWTFSFALSPTLESATSTAYQVERSKFDSILLNNARRKGVDVRENHTVQDIIEEEGRVTGVVFKDQEGQRHLAKSKYVGVAAGNTSHLYRKLDTERVYSEFFRNVALFGYYEGGKRLPAPNQGNILTVAFEDGWFWYIPLSDTLTSVGAVIARERADQIQQLGHEAAMEKFIEACPIIADHLKDAERVTEGVYGSFRVRKDYSYCNSSFWGPGVFSVGDAACFVDPVFSSGVHLATYSALLAARSVNTCLLGKGIGEQQAFTEFESRYRREYGIFYQFLCAFYDFNKSQDSYFWEARKVLNSDQTNLEAFVSLVGGVSQSGESLYGDEEEFRRATASISDDLGSAVDKATLGDDSPEFLSRSKFMGSLWQESRQIGVQAERGHRRRERPLTEGGLIVSPDGLHWDAPLDSAELGSSSAAG